MKSNQVCCALLTCAMALSLVAGPASKDPVAEGYLDWANVSEKTHLFGRSITPSDLRQRVVIYVVVDAEQFKEKAVADFFPMVQRYSGIPAEHMTQWETAVLPHDALVVFSVRNAGKDVTPQTFPECFKPPKDTQETEAAAYRGYAAGQIPFYRNLAPVGEVEITLEKLPYVAVYGGSGTESFFSKEKFTMAEFKDVQAAVTKARATVPEDWVSPLGVKEPQYFKQVPPMLAKMKPVQPALSILKAGIKSKVSEQAKEAQIMYDAINQYKGELLLRLSLEYKAAPARAYYDFQTLVKLFPSEKKKMQAVDAYLKQNKEIGSLGKVFEKMMLWSRDDFVCKNAGEAKKIVLELQKYKKALEVLAASPNATIQGEAMLFGSQLDTLIEAIPTKVPQK